MRWTLPLKKATAVTLRPFLARGETLTERLFFVHVLKTGGTSLAFSLASYYPRTSVYPDLQTYFRDKERYFDNDYLISNASELRQKYRFIYGHYRYFVTRHFPEHRVIAFLRDPVARTLSHLGQYRRLPHYQDCQALEIYQQERKHLANLQTRFFCDPKFEAPLLAMDTGHDSEAIIHSALSHLRQCFFIGIYESFDASVAQLKSLLGLKRRVLPRMNTTPPRRKVDAPDALIEQIRADNQLDQALYEGARSLVTAREEPLR